VKRLLVASVAAALVTAAGNAWAAAPPTKQPGNLIVGFDLPATGFVNGTATGTTVRNPSGFEVDLANLIAKKLGNLKVVWLRSPFPGLFSPAPKKFDFAVEEITITAQRGKVVDFSAPYFNANQGVLMSKKAPVPKNLADLRKLQTCAQATTTGLDYIQHQLRPVKKPLIYQSTATAFEAVTIGRCDALVLDVPIIGAQKKAQPNAFGPIGGQIVTNEQYGALFQKGNPLRAQVSTVIKGLRADGTLAKLSTKWFGVTPVNPRVLK
jgi:polar amino acid transport system substrate-binding protein